MTAVWGFSPDVLELHPPSSRRPLARSSSWPCRASLVAEGDRERDCTMVHEIIERKHLWRFHFADSRVPTQIGRDKIQTAGAPCRPKLAKSLRGTESALRDELHQGRACCLLLRCLAATTVDSSVFVEAGVGIQEHDHLGPMLQRQAPLQNRTCSSPVCARGPCAETNRVLRPSNGAEIAGHLGFSMAIVTCLALTPREVGEPDFDSAPACCCRRRPHEPSFASKLCRPSHPCLLKPEHMVSLLAELGTRVPPFLGLLRCSPNPVPTVPVVPKNCCQAFIFNC